MEVSQRQIESFKELYRSRFDVRLTDEEALDQALALLKLVKSTYQPIKQSEVERLT